MPETREQSPSDRFTEQGFFVGRSVLQGEALGRLQDAADSMMRIAEQNPADMFCNYYLKHRTDQGALYDVYQRDPAFRAATENPRVIELLQQVYAEEFYLFENSVVYKPEGADNAVPWHQDFMYMSGDPEKAIVWVALDKVDESNGCLRVIPGSHAKGTLAWSEFKGETHHKRTNPDQIDASGAVPVLMEPGDILVFHQNLLHSSEKVDGRVRRRAYRFAIKRLENSYTPRATPIVLARRAERTSLLEPYVDRRRPGPIGKVGRTLVRIGEKLGYR